MRIQPLASLFALLLVTLPAIASEDLPTKVVELDGLRISIPMDWEVLPQADTLLTARAPSEGPDDKFGENIRLKVHEIPKRATLDQLRAAQTRIVPGEYEIVGEGEIEGAPQRTLWYAVAEMKPADPSEVLTMLIYMLVKNNRAYLLHCTVETDKFALFRSRFEAIAKSIEIPSQADDGTDDGHLVARTPEVVAPPKSNAERKRSEAFEQGRVVGKVVFLVMLAAVVLWGVAWVARRLLARA